MMSTRYKLYLLLSATNDYLTNRSQASPAGKLLFETFVPELAGVQTRSLGFSRFFVLHLKKKATMIIFSARCA